MIILLHINEMKELKQHILEKLKVSKNSDITLESLLNVLKDYTNRNNSRNNYVSLWGILKEYPHVLQYYGTNAHKNIIGNEILGLRYNNKDEVFIYFNQFVGDSIQIENTEELNDIFGEDVLNKIYNYLKQ